MSGFGPVTGPLAGGTLVSIHGYAFKHGVDYRCRFGSVNRTVGATYDDVAQQLLCHAPAGDRWDGIASSAPLEVSLNGQQYTTSGVIFAQHAPFSPRVLLPPRGANLGGGLVRVNFDSRGQSVPFEDIRCRFGAADSTTPLQHTSEWALCLAPPSYFARATSFEHYLPFGDAENATDGSVRLDTIGDAAVTSGVLRLTDPSADNQYLTDLAKIKTRSAALGSAIITLRRPYNALFWFEVTFEVLVGSEWLHGGHGFSVCLGDLNASQPFGEEGQGLGLRVLFKSDRVNSPPEESIEVWYDGEQLLMVPLGKWLRTNSWVPVVIRHDEDGLVSLTGSNHCPRL